MPTLLFRDKDLAAAGSSVQPGLPPPNLGVRRAIETNRPVNLVHGPSAQKVDPVVRKDSPYRRVAFGRRQQRSIDGASVWMVTAEDLLLSKLARASEGGSELQLRDARALAALVETLDWTYLEHWSHELGVADRLQELRR